MRPERNGANGVGELWIEDESATPAGTATRYALTSGRHLVGRGDGADWRLADPTRLVSSIHCAIEVDGGKARITDLSRNGTTLDGQPLDGGEAPLPPGATIGIGPYRVRHVSDGEPHPTALPPRVSTDADDLVARTARSGMRLVSDIARASAARSGTLDLSVVPPGDAERDFDRLLNGDATPLERMEETGDALATRERAWLPAVQIALFRTLNELSPHSLDDEIAGLGADARRWRRYREMWESKATETENGMLDVFMRHLEDSYREELEEFRAGRTDNTQTRDRD